MIRIVIIAIVVLLMLGGVIWAFFGGPLSVVPKQEVSGQPSERIIKVASIIEDPVVYDGLTIEVTDQVSDWVTKKSFKMGTPGGFFGSAAQGLLVIREQDFKLPAASSENEIALGEEGSKVRVRGVVRIMTREQVQKVLDVDLEKTDIGTFKETPVIVASRVQRIP